MGGQGGGGGGISNANAGVPASKRNIVHSLKEIVNCSELEIYAMLVECDMDPDEAVSRLLSQDTFHEVKSKRDKKKETKDPADSWTRNILNRGARSFNDSYNTSRGGGNKYNSNDFGSETGSGQGIPPNRRENGARNHWTGSSLSFGVLGRQPPSNSVPTSSEVKKAPIEPSETITSSSLPTHVYQSVWVNANPGQKTLAEILKMGKLNQQKNVVLPRSSEAQESGSKAPLKDEWPSIEKQDVYYPSANVLKPSADSKMSAEQFSESQHLDETHFDDHHDEAKTNEVGSPPDADNISPASVLSRNLLNDDSRESSVCDDENNNKAERHSYEENGAEDVSASAATGFEQFTIDNEEEHEALPKEDKPAVIIPNHLQVHTSECSHLMFGTFGSGIGSGQASGLNDNLDKPLEPGDDSSFKHPDTNFYGEGEEQRRIVTTNEQASYQIDSSARNYQSATASETEAVQHEPPQEEGHQYKFSSSADYGFENNQQLNPPSEKNSQMQNLDTYPNVMQQGYTSSLPNTLLPSGIQDARDSDIHYSHFPTKYNTATPSSLSGPSISMAEALRVASMSPQNVMSSAEQQAATLAQHLALNPYSHQPGMALGPYGNLISYPFMQSYNPYLPSGFQQFHAGNHQSLPGMLPQYKTQATAPSAPMPSPYGFGGAAASSNNFPLNPTSAANSYEDVLNSQFKDINHLASLQQQNENSAAWHQGQQPNSQVVPGSGYYSFPDLQNQQPHGFPQAQQLQQQQQQQPSQQQQQQHFGGHGYVSPYHSQARMSLDQLRHQHQQQQNARDASKQSQQQLWPNNY